MSQTKVFQGMSSYHKYRQAQTNFTNNTQIVTNNSQSVTNPENNDDTFNF